MLCFCRGSVKPMNFQLKRMMLIPCHLCLAKRERGIQLPFVHEIRNAKPCKFHKSPSASAAVVSRFSLQVSNFLSGTSPLTLTLRLGDHMVFIQLQLSSGQGCTSRLQSTAVNGSEISRNCGSAGQYTARHRFMSVLTCHTNCVSRIAVN